MEYFSDREYLRCYNLLSKIIRSIIPINDHARLEDYVHDCIYYVVKKRQQDPKCELKTSYLKHIAIKICVDSLRSLGTNIKYYCPPCGSYMNRKEKAIECCEIHKKNNPDLQLYAVSYNEMSLSALNIMEDVEESFITHKEDSLNPLNLAEKSEFFTEFESYLSEIQRKIVELLIDGVNIKGIRNRLNLDYQQFNKNLKEIQFTYKWIEAKSK